jgi:hypothetical protein
LEPLPVVGALAKVEYRIAYIAFCLENSDAGRTLFEALKGITAIDPDRFKDEDTATIDGEEALYIEKIRNEFFAGIEELFRVRQTPEGDHNVS